MVAAPPYAAHAPAYAAPPSAPFQFPKLHPNYTDPAHHRHAKHPQHVKPKEISLLLERYIQDLANANPSLAPKLNKYIQIEKDIVDYLKTYEIEIRKYNTVKSPALTGAKNNATAVQNRLFEVLTKSVNEVREKNIQLLGQPAVIDNYILLLQSLLTSSRNSLDVLKQANINLGNAMSAPIHTKSSCGYPSVSPRYARYNLSDMNGG